MKLVQYYSEGDNVSKIKSLSQHFNINETVMKIIYQKGYKSIEQIDEFLHAENLPFKSSFLLHDMQKCVDKILFHAKNKSKILIFGDYDVDGMGASYVMLNALKLLGVQASYYLPNRFVDGYGLNIKTLDFCFKKFNPDLIITVDCGITALEEVEYCKQNNVDIIITDHHEIPEVLPNCICVNPKIQNQDYDFSGLCGAGVAFKVACALLGENQCEFLLPVVAISTIADIVPLVDENRKIIKKGLGLCEQYLPVGLKHLFKDNRISIKSAESVDIAFRIAPKLNATGRLGDASISLELMLETDLVKIKKIITIINEYNTKRQEICNNVFEDCKKMLAGENLSNVSVIILKSKDWDSGILGIVCSKLVDAYKRPTILFCEEDGVLKGSARSNSDVNIHAILQSVSSLLEVFGGHKVAAGLTLKLENFEMFKNTVNSFVATNVNSSVFVPTEYYDIKICLKDINMEFFNDLKLIEPCGCENTKPRFLLQSSSAKIYPLKPGSSHCNIVFNKKLSLIMFYYLQHQAKLNFSSEYNFIFEFSEFNRGVFKGICKCFSPKPQIKESAYQFFDAFKLLQLGYKAEKNTKFTTYDNILPFVLNCENQIFGNCFVCFDGKRYNDFINNYNTQNIYDIEYFKDTSIGVNSLMLCPQGFEFAKHYKNIIFIDNVLSSGYIEELKKHTKANIYLPKQNNIGYSLPEVNLDFDNINQTKGKLKLVQNMSFPSIISVYTKLVTEHKYQCSFAEYLVCFNILKELGILTALQSEFFSFKITDIKKSYKESKLFCSLNLYRRISDVNI